MKANINNDDKGNRISWGPRLTINLNVLDFGIIRALANIHEVEVKWNRRNGVPVPRPDVNYLVGFRVKVAPNIEAEITNTMIKFVEGKFNDFTNMIILSVYF